MGEKHQFTVSKEKLKDLQDLAEERNLSQLIVNALTMYYSILKFEAEKYKLTMLPTKLDGSFDFQRPIIFIDELFGIYE